MSRFGVNQFLSAEPRFFWGAVSEQDWREISSHLPGDWADFLESV